MDYKDEKTRRRDKFKFSENIQIHLKDDSQYNMISNLTTSQNGQITSYLVAFGTAIRPKNYKILQVL